MAVDSCRARRLDDLCGRADYASQTQRVDDRKCDMRRSTRYWIAAGSVLLFAALILIAYLAFVSIAYADPGTRGPR